MRTDFCRKIRKKQITLESKIRGENDIKETRFKGVHRISQISTYNRINRTAFNRPVFIKRYPQDVSEGSAR
jgi:hypothetical protein